MLSDQVKGPTARKRERSSCPLPNSSLWERQREAIAVTEEGADCLLRVIMSQKLDEEAHEHTPQHLHHHICSNLFGVFAESSGNSGYEGPRKLCIC